METEGNKKVLIKAICQGIAAVVSNVSFQNHTGLAAWTIEGANKHNRVIGYRRTPGFEEDQSAYQSELSQLWGIVNTLVQMSECYHIMASTETSPTK